MLLVKIGLCRPLSAGSAQITVVRMGYATMKKGNADVSMDLKVSISTLDDLTLSFCHTKKLKIALICLSTIF